MIKYKLICKDCENIFDSWFSSCNDYERLEKKKFLSCHICNSLNVNKTLMSPSVLMKKIHSNTNNQIQKYKETKKAILKYQEFIKKNFDFVGTNFAYEARSVHYKSKKASKGIYGIATKKDIKELKEEGIEAERITWIKDNMN